MHLQRWDQGSGNHKGECNALGPHYYPRYEEARRGHRDQKLETEQAGPGRALTGAMALV